MRVRVYAFVEAPFVEYHGGGDRDYGVGDPSPCAAVPLASAAVLPLPYRVTSSAQRSMTLRKKRQIHTVVRDS